MILIDFRRLNRNFYSNKIITFYEDYVSLNYLTGLLNNLMKVLAWSSNNLLIILYALNCYIYKI